MAIGQKIAGQSQQPCFCLHLGTRLTELLEISTKRYLISKRNG